jgi:hypothetical protein
VARAPWGREESAGQGRGGGGASERRGIGRRWRGGLASWRQRGSTALRAVAQTEEADAAVDATALQLSSDQGELGAGAAGVSSELCRA